MARSPAWRRSLTAWKRELTQWLSTPTPDNVMTGSMFMDLRLLYGRRELADTLREHALHYMSHEQASSCGMAQNMVNFTPRRWAGSAASRWKIRRAPRRGRPLKKAGIFAITDGIKGAGRWRRRLDGSTHDRMEALVEAGVLKPEQVADLRRLRLPGADATARPGRGLARRAHAGQPASPSTS